MSKEYSRRESHQRCNACDFQKLKQLENNPAVRRLRDQIEQLTFRLTECRNENQMLKRDLQLARKMVYQEVGGRDVDFQNLMKFGTEYGSKGRQENVLLLKHRVQELKEYLRELEGDASPPEVTPSEEFVKNRMPRDAKKLWRLELERRLAKEEAEKDINPLVQECMELRRNLDSEKTRFRELSEEVKLLRAELQSQVEKNEEDFNIVNSFKTLETQLQETLAERGEIRKELEGSRSRNKRLTEEIATLNDELKTLQKKTDDTNVLITSLTNTHKSLQEAIDSEKNIVQQNQDRYREELRRLQEEHGEDLLILDHLQCIVGERNDLVDDLRIVIEESPEEENGKEAEESKSLEKAAVKESAALQPTVSKSKEERDDAVEEDKELKTRELRMECAMYKALCAAAKAEGERLYNLVTRQESKLNEVAVQVVEAGRLIMLKNAEKKELMDKVSKLQRAATSAARRKKIHPVQPRSRLEELRIKADAQREENVFLRNFLRTAVCNKGKDLQTLKGFVEDAKGVLRVSKIEIKKLMLPEPKIEEEVGNGTEA